LISLAAAGLIALLLFDYFYYRNRIYPGVYLQNISLGGAAPAAAEEAIAKAALTFECPGGAPLTIPLVELGFIPDQSKILEQAYRCGRQNRWPLNFTERLRLLTTPVYLPFPYRVDEKKLQQGLLRLENAFNREPKNASIAAGETGAPAEIIAEKPGFKLSRPQLVHRIHESLSVLTPPPCVTVPGERIDAAITARLLRAQGITTLMSTFTTLFDLTKTNRVHNIELAASLINHYFLAPGAVLSLNDFYGETTAEKGYKEAPVIVGRELVPGFGGGLCQISSTFYNAALLAGLEIVERHNHDLTVPYIEPGRDATISYGARDLKVRNNTEHTIMIEAFVEGDALTFRVFGSPTGKKVEIETRKLAVYPPPEIIEIDPALAPGEEEIDAGYPGYLVEVWLIVSGEGRVESRTKISEDRYHPYPTIIRRGPEK
jgi:vancomycin resistance protein YoaR